MTYEEAKQFAEENGKIDSVSNTSTSFPSLLNSSVFVIAYVKSLVVKIVWFASEWLYGFVLPYLQVYCSWRPVRRREFAGAIAVIDDVLCLMIVLPH